MEFWIELTKIDLIFNDFWRLPSPKSSIVSRKFYNFTENIKHFLTPNEASKPHETESQNIQTKKMKCISCENAFRYSMKLPSSASRLGTRTRESIFGLGLVSRTRVQNESKKTSFQLFLQHFAPLFWPIFSNFSDSKLYILFKLTLSTFNKIRM